ncbi:MAG: hypothetical protein WHT65_09530 [Pseudothermotoga sp.]
MQRFIVQNIGSSICLVSRDNSLLQWVCSQVARQITKEYLILSEPGIDEIRYFTDFLYTAADDGYKLVFIQKADRLLQEAANSMLKILEEPPSYSAIVLTTTRFSDLLPTIRSRVKTMNVSVNREIYDSVWKKISTCPDADLIFELCKNDFDILIHLNESTESFESTNFDETEFVQFFSENDLSAAKKIKAVLMLEELYRRLLNLSEKELVQLYMNLMEKSNKIDLNGMIVFMCKAFQMILELKGCRDLSVFKWLDSIVANRLVNFNGSLTLLNLLILIKRSRKR